GGIDHVFYGWIFFGLVIFAVMFAARRWFDRPANDAAVDVAGLEGRPRLAGSAKAVLPLALAVPLFFAAWGTLSAARAAPLPPEMTLIAPPGWSASSFKRLAWTPRFDGADRQLLRDFSDAEGRRVTVAIG